MTRFEANLFCSCLIFSHITFENQDIGVILVFCSISRIFLISSKVRRSRLLELSLFLEAVYNEDHERILKK